MIGTAFIAVGLWRVLTYHSTEKPFFDLESSILYWHFVDVVWLFLFISTYYRFLVEYLPRLSAVDYKQRN